jgi:putative ABC transport system permease protein
MLTNYFKIAWRSIIKHRFYSLVNIIGLATGITFAFLIGSYAWQELQVNKHIKNSKDQYIIQSKWKDPNQGYELAAFGPLAKALREQYPNLVANYYRWDGITSTVSVGDKHFREGLQVGDSSFLSMYGFKLLSGDAKTALNDPFSVVITEEKALKYFGKKDVVGQTLAIQSFSGTTHDFMITGVLKKPQDNSVLHLTYDNDNQIYLSTVCGKNFFNRDIDTWQNQYVVGFIELQNGVTPKDLQKPMQQLIIANTPPQVYNNVKPYLVSLQDYYLNSNNGLVKKMLYTLSGIALFILLMAVINFINISISRSASRMREIGVRKVMGGMQKQLVLQFLIESVVLAACATVVALLLYAVTRNFFSTMLGKSVPRFADYPGSFIPIPLLIAFGVGVLAGVYPALVLSSLKAVDSIKGKLKTANENIIFRKALVGFQFCTATIVFIGALIISKQIALFFSNDLGYNKEYIISTKLPRDWSPAGVQHMEAMRDEFTKLPELAAASLSYEIPDGNNAGGVPVYKYGADSTTAIAALQLTTDENYASVYQIPMQAGVFFKTPYAGIDSSKVVINQAAAKALGWQDANEAVGKQLKIPGAPFVLTIAGVTRDFHFGSMQGPITPIVFLHVKFGIVYRMFSFKLKPGNVAATIGALHKKWSSLFPHTPFDYSFMDDSLKRIYQTELQLKQASFTAAGLSLLIVLLGVIGLISLSIQKRTKEIGIRKVLGATVSSIMSLFLKEFLVVILIAGLVACPVAYLIMQGWLNNYVYRIPVTAQPFIAAIAVLVFITTALICGQTTKAALDNPGKSLRTE